MIYSTKHVLHQLFSRFITHLHTIFQFIIALTLILIRLFSRTEQTLRSDPLFLWICRNAGVSRLEGRGVRDGLLIFIVHGIYKLKDNHSCVMKS